MCSSLADLHRFTSLGRLSGLVAAASHAFLKRPRYAIAPTVHGPALIVISDGKPSDIVLGDDERALRAYLTGHVPHAAPAGSMPVFWDIGIEVLIALDEAVVPNGLDREAVGPWLGDTILRRFRDERTSSGEPTGDTRH
ncbi:hypothetical protein J2Y55_004652 [Bosea sp. BE125]|uniref:hypothetical protein n=1 Tax=Bosea sp. BE125 TaxID=2817909 RepID=UPI00286604A0|nr:hypothetical protein [Bosea sp. BE125]MDR6873625.1 hypothetical protein [Bosea sp. BE125]